MHKTIRRVLSLLALILIVAPGPACGGDGDQVAPDSASETPVKAFTPPGSVATEEVERAIQRELERLRNVPGRTGILAEKKEFSLFEEELIIRDFFKDRRNGFFLDVGCAWPLMANNTAYLEKYLGWKGIGIDALAEYGPAWREKRPNSEFFAYLVTDHSNVKETFYRSPSTGLSSTDKEMASGTFFGAGLEPEALQVETVTLNDILDRAGVSKIDLLAMDIEGHEPKALAGFDIDRFRPDLAIIEHTIPPDGSDPVYDYFKRHGYELIEKYRPFDNVNRYFKRKAP